MTLILCTNVMYPMLYEPTNDFSSPGDADEAKAAYDVLLGYVGAPRGPLHGGRSTRAAPRGSLHEGVADLFYTDVRSILMVLC